MIYGEIFKFTLRENVGRITGDGRLGDCLHNATECDKKRYDLLHGESLVEFPKIYILKKNFC